MSPCDIAKITKSSFTGKYGKDVQQANDQADADLWYCILQ